MTFHTQQKNIDQLTFSINGKQIENVKFFKFLGIMFDEHLTGKNHITMLTYKLCKVIGILNRLKNIYPQQALLSIYNALFLSHMTYGLLLWGNQDEQVSKVQKKSIPLIAGSEYLAHCEPLFKELELLKNEDLFYYNLSYGLLPSYFNFYQDVLNVNTPCGYELNLDCLEQDSYLPNHVYYIS